MIRALAIVLVLVAGCETHREAVYRTKGLAGFNCAVDVEASQAICLSGTQVLRCALTIHAVEPDDVRCAMVGNFTPVDLMKFAPAEAR